MRVINLIEESTPLAPRVSFHERSVLNVMLNTDECLNLVTRLGKKPILLKIEFVMYDVALYLFTKNPVRIIKRPRLTSKMEK